MAWVEKRGDMWRVRFRNPDGSVATDSTHPTKTAASTRANAIETDQQRDVFINPEHGRITLAEWVEQWLDAHDVGASTFERYRSHLDIHILPRFGDTPLNGITRMAVKRWIKDLNRRRADSTVASILSLLSMIMGEAVEERRITMNPCRRLRNTSAHRPERPWANPTQVNAIASRVTTPNRIMIITAAYTGMRWGELAGLRRPNCKLGDGRILIDPDEGALHEVGGHLTLGPPKTPAAVRDILLPPFLVELLRTHLDSHDHDHVFTGRDGGLHRRSSFHRRHWRPATDGDPTNGIPAIIRGLHFHDLRHSHKTWLIEDDVPEVAQAKRLGHRLPGIRGIYSHVSPTVEQRLADRLQARWERTPRPWGDNTSH
ncbi:site-specific integrase [Solwaraspora sp. WMMD791]|uniref:tyrosine-type recombinase/integrase n=1 Tax=Solwaraspora sp. WMMD791 TaxID=3016086 RepID=UPI00249CDD70|nr:site-specific integrase [Solwaraspora sp. WMMD791]WFE27612.1 site-specific integrase [Solwaraspora sp. WMMD791]